MAVGADWLPKGAQQKQSSAVARAARRIAKLPLHFYLDLPVTIAAALRRSGLAGHAQRFLWRVHCAHPYDLALGEHLANLIYEDGEGALPLGTVARGAFLMRVLDKSFPSARVVAAYFQNLDRLLEGRERRGDVGRIVLGLGSGRCGSASLAGILGQVPGGVSTHENPPRVFWEPLPRQVDFHLRRFERFGAYFPLVADCAHWWINLVDVVFAAFPTSKAIGLYRDLDACVRSWMTVSPEDVNHWVVAHNRIWPDDAWDPLYPHYDLPEDAQHRRRQVKEMLVRRYVVEYNERLRQLAARMPERVLLIRTEELDLPQTRLALSEFLGLPIGLASVRLNVGFDGGPSPDSMYF
jgi:hypothetical protein